MFNRLCSLTHRLGQRQASVLAARVVEVIWSGCDGEGRARLLRLGTRRPYATSVSISILTSTSDGSTRTQPIRKYSSQKAKKRERETAPRALSLQHAQNNATGRSADQTRGLSDHAAGLRARILARSTIQKKRTRILVRVRGSRIRRGASRIRRGAGPRTRRRATVRASVTLSRDAGTRGLLAALNRGSPLHLRGRLACTV
jgi:hypothetical protein